MTFEHLRAETFGHLLVVTIDRPGQRNALTHAAHYEMGEAFDRFEADPELWVAIVTGAGDKAFCAGADLKEAAATGFKSSRPWTPPSGFGGLTHRFDRRKPVIAAVNGVATGGGFEIALACDIVIAAESARFGLTEPRLGLAAVAGGVQRLAREIGPKRASAMLLTGHLVDAAEGLALGFVNRVVPLAELMNEARRWAEEIQLCSPASIAATKAILAACDGKSIEAAMQAMGQLDAYKAMQQSPDRAEGVRAFAERRAPRWANPT